MEEHITRAVDASRRLSRVGVAFLAFALGAATPMLLSAVFEEFGQPNWILLGAASALALAGVTVHAFASATAAHVALEAARANDDHVRWNSLPDGSGGR